jgi:hypothetical protein
MKIMTKLWIGIAVLIVLTPLGLFLPEHFKAAGAWGEWSAAEMQKLVGYIPKGMQKLSNLWSAPMPDYAFKGGGEKSLPHFGFAYIISALAGIAVIVIAVLIIGKMLSKKGE